jgi:serine/threonine-protein kinase RsbT
MGSDDVFTQTFEVMGSDFNKAGRVSIEIKELLQELGISPAVIHRLAIATYEAEMNIVMYTSQGTLQLALSPEEIIIEVFDRGPGIPDIGQAMKEGYSTATAEMQERGFGAGMGLPNIKKNSDVFEITSTVGQGTRLRMVFHLSGRTAGA